MYFIKVNSTKSGILNSGIAGMFNYETNLRLFLNQIIEAII